VSEPNPYQAPAAAVADVYLPDETVLADRGTRLGAVILDSLLVFLPGGLLSAVTIPFALAQRGRRPDPGSFYLFLIPMGIVLLVVGIWNLVWLYTYGQTIAKRLLKVKIVRKDGTRAGLARILFLRMLLPAALRFIPFAGWFFPLVDACFIFREDRRCIHDWFADTLVVKA
jgi:uncharacterized RDD family membrane protein YckC